MMHILVSALVFSLLYAIKGGQLGRIPVVKAIQRMKPFGVLLDGKILSTIGALVFGFALGLPPLRAVYLAAGWLLAIAPSVGEEISAVGGFKGGWGPYYSGPLGQRFGIGMALQRGVFAGAALALALNSTTMILFGALFPVAIYIGVSLMQLQQHIVKADWVYHEFIYGAFLGAGIGLII